MTAIVDIRSLQVLPARLLRLVHFVFSDVTSLLNPPEYIRHLPRRAIYARHQRVWTHSRRILCQTAASDMGQALGDILLDQRQGSVRIEPSRR